MKAITTFATEYVVNEECEVLEWGGPEGLEYPVKTTCDKEQNLFLRPQFYIPVIAATALMVVVATVLIVKKKRKR